MFDHKYDDLKEVFSAYSFDDVQTKAAISEIYKHSGYVMDPHGAVGYLGVQEFLKINSDYFGVFLETAHPVKFLNTVEEVIAEKVEVPSSIKSLFDKKKKSLQIDNYEDLKGFLLS